MNPSIYFQKGLHRFLDGTKPLQVYLLCAQFIHTTLISSHSITTEIKIVILILRTLSRNISKPYLRQGLLTLS